LASLGSLHALKQLFKPLKLVIQGFGTNACLIKQPFAHIVSTMPEMQAKQPIMHMVGSTATAG
jgi:hypothetical protein